MAQRITRGALRGAIIGALAGLGLAGIYLLLGKSGNELTESLAYSLVIIGFPAVFAASPVLNWLGLDTGMALVLLSLPLNGSLWGAFLGALLIRPITSNPEGPNDEVRRGAA